MWFYAQLAAIASLVVGYVLLLVWVLRNRSGYDGAQRLLEAFALFSVVWTLALGVIIVLEIVGWESFLPTSDFLALLTSDLWQVLWRRTVQIGLVIVAFLTVQFTDAFVQRSSRRWPLLLVVILLSLATVGLDILSFFFPYLSWQVSFIRIRPVGLGSLLLVLAWLFCAAIAWWTCITAFYQATGSKHRNRVRYLSFALIAFTIGDLFVLFNGVPGVYIGFAIRLLGFFVTAFAILHHELPDLRRWILGAIRFVFLSGIVFSLYFVILLIASYISGSFPSWQHLDISWAIFIPSLLFAAILDVILGPRLHRFFDRAILGLGYDVQSALRTYSEQISLILDLDRLSEITLEWLGATLRVRSSAFVLLTPVGDGQVELRVLRATMDSLPDPHLFGINNRFVMHFQNVGHPLSQYDLDMLSWFQAMPVDEKKWLRALAMDLYVPVLVADKPVALLALGPKAGGQPYSGADLETLMTLAGQTGTALDNARLVEDLRAVQNDLHRLNSELAETNRQLQRLDQTKADFIAIASHELRTPLTQIYGYSDILSSLESDELGDAQVVHRFISGISRGASRLKQVVDAMVDVSLIDTGALVLTPEITPLSVVVRNAAETVRSAAERRNVTLTVRDLSDLPYIRADGYRLEQVFVSLLSNAVKFTPDEGQVVVSGRLDSSSTGKAYVELEVADTGIGIDPDQHDLIFDKFYRSEDTLLHSTDDVGFKGAGPGLGLAIAKGIIEAHEGRIWVESSRRDEKRFPGSTFCVQLPVAGPTTKKRDD